MNDQIRDRLEVAAADLFEDNAAAVMYHALVDVLDLCDAQGDYVMVYALRRVIARNLGVQQVTP